MNEFMDEGGYEDDIDSVSTPLNFAMGGPVDAMHLTPYTATNQEDGDYQDSHSMPQMYAQGGEVEFGDYSRQRPMPMNARQMLQSFAEGGLAQRSVGSPFDLNPIVGPAPTNTPEALFRASSPYSQVSTRVQSPTPLTIPQETESMFQQKLGVKPTQSQSDYWSGIFGQDNKITPDEIQRFDAAVGNAGKPLGEYQPNTIMQTRDVFGPMSMMTGGTGTGASWQAPTVTTRPPVLISPDMSQLSLSQQYARDLAAKDATTNQTRELGKSTVIGGTGNDTVSGGTVNQQGVVNAGKNAVDAGDTMAAEKDTAIKAPVFEYLNNTPEQNAKIRGMLTGDNDYARGQLMELYTETFNRVPDTAGFNYWLNTIGKDNILTKDEIAQWNANAQKELAQMDQLKGLYGKYLQREPDDAGRAYWMGQIAAAGGVNSGIESLFQQGANREVTMGNAGYRPGLYNQMGSRETPEAVAQLEAQAPFRFGPNDYARSQLLELYTDVLGRPVPDEEGFNWWLQNYGSDNRISKEEENLFIEAAQRELNARKMAKGGPVKKDNGGEDLTPVQSFGKGGTVKKAAEVLSELVEAPSVVLRGKLSELEKYLFEKHGASEAKRLQKAADEVKNLEDQYTTEALKEVFRGDNTKPLLVVADPAKFQDFAARLKEPYRPAVERYWREMSAGGGGAEYVPYLRLNKDEGKLPYVAGHEGRHRNIAMTELGYPSTIWQIMTQSGLRGPLPRRTREEYLKALFDQIGEKPLVIPESRWTPETKDKLFVEERVRDWKKARTLPEPFKHGGLVHRQSGSPEYGEIAIGGGVTPDTKTALTTKQGFSGKEAMDFVKRVYGEGASNLESLVRGSVAAIPGSFGDIESIFRDDKNRKLATTEEILRDRMPKRMTTPTKEGAGFEEVGTYLPLPIPAGTVTQAAKTAGKGVETGAAKMLEKLGPRRGRKWESVIASMEPARSYAVKPKGGTFYPPDFGSNLDDYINQTVRGLSTAENLSGKDAKVVAQFIQEKGRKYLTSIYGTADDPLRQALMEGRLPRYDSDKERFRGYALDAARAGNPEAVEDLEKAYDNSTRLQTLGYMSPSSTENVFTIGNRIDEGIRQRLLAEGVPEELINTSYPTTQSSEAMRGGYSDAKKKLGELLGAMERVAPTADDEKMRQAFIQGVGNLNKGDESLLYAAIKGEPIYDISTPNMDFMKSINLARAIASIPVNELERMTFPEAVVKGTQNMKFQKDWQLSIQKARDGKPVPKEIYFRGTEPVYEVDKNLQWVRVMSPDAVELEGAAMRHSIGGYKTSANYNLGGKDAFNSGLARVYSLRNEKGIPQVTVEAKFTDDDGLEIRQIRSKFNSEPTQEEKSAIYQLFDTLGPKEIRSTSYLTDRAGNDLKENSTTVNWGDLYKSYSDYKGQAQGFSKGGAAKKESTTAFIKTANARL